MLAAQDSLIDVSGDTDAVRIRRWLNAKRFRELCGVKEVLAVGLVEHFIHLTDGFIEPADHFNNWPGPSRSCERAISAVKPPAFSSWRRVVAICARLSPFLLQGLKGVVSVIGPVTLPYM